MTETSFPIVGKKLTEAQWGTIASSFGQGIIDYGGHPYRWGPVNDVTDEVTIEVDTLTGANEAIVRGFVHSIDEPKVLHLPPVATTTVYEVGLVYDPLKHGTADGPLLLDVWTSPADYTGGKARLVLFRVTRSASSALSTSQVQEYRQRVAPLIAVTNYSHLPKVETMLTDTVAFVRATGAWYRVANNGTNDMSWVEIGNNLPPTSSNPDPGTIALRDNAGRLKSAAAGTGSSDVITRALFGNPTHTIEPGELVRRWSGSGTFHAPQPVAPADVVPKSYVDGKKWEATDLNKNGPAIPFELVSGSYPIRDRTATGTNYTVSVMTDGKLGRFSSKRADKDGIEPFTADPRRLLAPEVVQYRRRPEPGVPADPGARVEWGFIADDELTREGGVPELVLTEPDEDGNPRPESWDNAGLTAAHHRLLQWLTARVDEIDGHLGIDTAGGAA